MAEKDAYYFSHDANARHDPKISDMRSIYGMQGYGWYWVIVEMMREQADYKLKLCKANAMAMQMQCDNDTANNFINECINDFELFDSDGEYFWSNSLLRRMSQKEEKSKKYRENALKRWGKSRDSNNGNAMAMQSQSNGNALKESKVKESKEKKSNKKDIPKLNYAEKVTLTEEQYKKLVDKHGQENTLAFIEKLNNAKCANKKLKYTSDYHAILNWVVDAVLSKTNNNKPKENYSTNKSKGKDLNQLFYIGGNANC